MNDEKIDENHDDIGFQVHEIKEQVLGASNRRLKKILNKIEDLKNTTKKENDDVISLETHNLMPLEHERIYHGTWTLVNNTRNN